MKAAVLPEPVCEETIRSRPVEGSGNGLSLNRRRFAVAGVGQCFEDGRVKADFCKSHVLFRVDVPCAGQGRGALLKQKGNANQRKAERQTLFDQQKSAPISTKALCQNGAD
jgi:hypothetical protein